MIAGEAVRTFTLPVNATKRKLFLPHVSPDDIQDVMATVILPPRPFANHLLQAGVEESASNLHCWC